MDTPDENVNGCSPLNKELVQIEEKITANAIFISRLKALMEEKQLTQNELATCAKIAQSTVWGYLIGRTAPKSAELSRLADYFEVSMDYLWGSTDIPEKPDHIAPNDNSNLHQRVREAEEKLSKLKPLMQELGEDVQKLGATVNKLTTYVIE